jgi:hypothetical protein
MKTTGQILQAARLIKKLELDDVARITKIRPQFLKWLEADDYQRLPSGTVARGFIHNYSEFLGLNSDHLLAVFRRDFVENQQGQIVPRGMVDPVDKTSFWTPKSTVIALVTALFVVFGAYLIYQYYILTGPPSLTWDRPADNTVVNEESVEVSGHTDPEATLSVNGQLIALDKNGLFYFRVPVTAGSNKITIIAIGKSGKTNTITRTVTLTTGQ